MDVVSVMGVALLGCALTWFLVPLIRRYLRPSTRRQLHHTHTTPISRFGGLALVIAFVVAALVVLLAHPFRPEELRECVVVVVSAVAMFTLGFWDDVRPLGARRKLIGQILIASAVYVAGLSGSLHLNITQIRNPFTGVDYQLGAWSYLATVFWLITLTNLINLIDGVDGLAAGICLMAMGFLLFVGLRSDLVFAGCCAAGMCGALVGFLRYNFPPASIYLGDGGAYFLGFLIAILSMLHSHKGSVMAALLAPLFVLALPIVDVTLAILRRGLKGMPIFRADQRHLHHRLAQTGLSRTRIVLMFYGCSLFFLVLALTVFISQGRWLPISFGAACLVLLISARSFKFSREWFAVGKVLGNSVETRKQTRYALALANWLELESERSRSWEELWIDFEFCARKLGFATVSLCTPGFSREWISPTLPSDATGRHCRRFDLQAGVALEISASYSRLDSNSFELLSEVAAETWVKASGRLDQRSRRQGLEVSEVNSSPVVDATALLDAHESPPERGRAMGASVGRKRAPLAAMANVQNLPVRSPASAK